MESNHIFKVRWVNSFTPAKKKTSPKEPDVLGEISDGVIIVLHVMAHLKLVYTGIGYLTEGGVRTALSQMIIP